MTGYRTRRLVLFAASLPLWSTLAFAQPDPGNQPKGANPPNRNNKPFKGGKKGGDKETTGPQWTAWIRRLLSDAGLPDATKQDAVIAYLHQQDKARNDLQEKSRKVMEALRAQAPDDELAILLNDYQNAIQDVHDQRTRSEADLNKSISYAKNPHLAIVLLLLGVGNDGVPAPTQMFSRFGLGPAGKPQLTAPKGDHAPAGDKTATPVGQPAAVNK